MLWASGERYVGEWTEDKKHGQGTYYYSNGSIYIGDFVNDVPHGYGEFKKAEQTVYKVSSLLTFQGFWDKGNPTGVTLEIENGVTAAGTWNNGNFEKWTLIRDEPVMDDTSENATINPLVLKGKNEN